MSKKQRRRGKKASLTPKKETSSFERTKILHDYSFWEYLTLKVLQCLVTFKNCENKNSFFKKCLKFFLLLPDIFRDWKLQKHLFTLNLTLIPVYYVFIIPQTRFSQTLRSNSLKLTIQDHVEFHP